MKRLCVRDGCSYGRENGFLCDKHDQCPIFKSGTPQDCLKAYREAENPKESKYHNEKITIDGIVFDSKKEMCRYYELKLLEKAGKITDLQRQVKYILIPAQYETVETEEVYKVGENKGKHKTKQVCVEKECSYYADFVYKDENGKLVVEDTKSGDFRTKEYVIKRKLMLFVHGIKIREL